MDIFIQIFSESLQNTLLNLGSLLLILVLIIVLIGLVISLITSIFDVAIYLAAIAIIILTLFFITKEINLQRAFNTLADILTSESFQLAILHLV